MFPHLFAAGLAISAAPLVSGCTGGEDVGFDTEPLRTKATAYPEAVLVDAYQGNGTGAECSGALIAPRVVLTAGHCVLSYTSWIITPPNADDTAPISASDSDPGDYSETTPGTVNPLKHDVGLVFLDRAITLDSYPEVATSAAAGGQEVVTIGRRAQVGGVVSTKELYASDPFSIEAAGAAAPFDYESSIEIDHGDSGGPLLVSPADSPHVILAVNSGGLTSGSEYARVDLVSPWIRQAILAHGGPGN